MFVTHAFSPVYDANSRILILGTMPSPQSIRYGFYYSHPQNRFWPLLAAIFKAPVPQTPSEKEAFALRHGIALWDVLASCEIEGASDSSIRRPVPNDLSIVLNAAPIDNIYTTGKTAFNLFNKFLAPKYNRQAVYLPSTSPANQALFPWDTLLQTWRKTLTFPT
ncbi:MAG: DNA-deoxyinosine glycosylase [Victivallales bacterium]|nr:DNA-deoxyinosine glycosylase [Victivallales bacterium]